MLMLKQIHFNFNSFQSPQQKLKNTLWKRSFWFLTKNSNLARINFSSLFCSDFSLKPILSTIVTFCFCIRGRCFLDFEFFGAVSSPNWNFLQYFSSCWRHLTLHFFIVVTSNSIPLNPAHSHQLKTRRKHWKKGHIEKLPIQNPEWKSIQKTIEGTDTI